MREEENKRTSPKKSNVQTFFKKRWVFPAIYLVAAAIILTTVLWFQGNNDLADDFNYDNDKNPQDVSQNEPDSVVVNSPAENFVMPVLNEDVVEVSKKFYNVDGTAEEQEAALVFYDNTYTENKGIDIVAKDGSVFDVTASLGGTVTRSEKDSTLGHIVEIEHAEGVVTVYQSLSDVQVSQGDVVDQGQVIAKAGKNLLNKEAGAHVHFEIRNNGLAVDPEEFFGKPMTSLEEAQKEEEPAMDKEEPAADEEEPAAGEEEGTDEEAPADEEGSEEGADSESSEEATIGMARA